MSTPTSMAATPSVTVLSSALGLSLSASTASQTSTGSALPSSSLSSTSLTVDVTTTTRSAETTSTPQTTTTTSPVQTTTTQTSSQASTPSSSSTPSFTSASSAISSAHPSSTATSSSSSQQVTRTTLTSTYTTYVNGSAIPTQTSFPSTIPQLSTPSSSQRTAVIAGSAAGGTALLILLLSLAFCARRKQFKRLDFIQAISLKRKQERSRATLLDGEDPDDIDLARPPQRYTDYDTPWDGTQGRRTLVSAHSSRSESGSAFKEDLWPSSNLNANANAHEGTRLIDPVVYTDYPELDLSRIVDDVMGPSSSGTHFSDQSVASVYRGSVVESDGVVHSRTVSDASNIALLDAAGLGAPVTTTVAVRSSPLAQPGTKPAGSSEHESGGAS